MTPLSFSRASMLMCSFLELRKSRISLITSASFMLIVSSAVMLQIFWGQLIAGCTKKNKKKNKKENRETRQKAVNGKVTAKEEKLMLMFPMLRKLF